MEVGFGIAFLLLWAVMGLLSLVAFAFWIWMLIDCLVKEPSEGNDKLIWALVIVFTHWIGAAIYYFVRRPDRIQTYGE